MSIVIVSSTQDEASTNIKQEILSLDHWNIVNSFFDKDVYQHDQLSDVFLITIPDKTIIHENLEQQIKDRLKLDPSQFIFISRHRSKSGEPTLSTHPIGNFAQADFGGKSRLLTPAMPQLMTTLLRTMKSKAMEKKLKHEVTFEVTHHGPWLETPTVFAEVGSTIEEWVKKEPAHVVAESILSVLHHKRYESDYDTDIPVLIGVGGGHYAPRFSKVKLKKKVCFGHMIPSYHIKPGHIDKEMFMRTLDATPNVSAVYLDRKALSSSIKSTFENWCDELSIPLVSSKDFSSF